MLYLYHKIYETFTDCIINSLKVYITVHNFFSGKLLAKEDGASNHFTVPKVMYSYVHLSTVMYKPTHLLLDFVKFNRIQ